MQCEGQQFGGLHGTDIAAAKVLADYMGIPDVQTLRREPTVTHDMATGLFREMFGIYSSAGTPRYSWEAFYKRLSMCTSIDVYVNRCLYNHECQAIGLAVRIAECEAHDADVRRMSSLQDRVVVGPSLRVSSGLGALRAGEALHSPLPVSGRSASPPR